MDIKIDDLSGIKIRALLQEHLLGMAENTPSESIHALDLEALKSPEIILWTAWEGMELLGCGALKELNNEHAEIKSMRTAKQHLRKGVASRMVQHIIDQANKQGYKRLSLETGSQDSFKPARELYSSFGFKYCEPFIGYKEDPNSVFMALYL